MFDGGRMLDSRILTGPLSFVGTKGDALPVAIG